MITEKNDKLLTSQCFLTDCTKKGLAYMYSSCILYQKEKRSYKEKKTGGEGEQTRRYPQRQLPVTNYMYLEVPDDDEFICK